MKTTIFTSLLCLLVFMGCNKDENNIIDPEPGDIIQYILSFDLLKSDGSAFEQGEVQISTPHILDEKGQLVPLYSEYWADLKVIYEEDFFLNNTENPEHYNFPDNGILYEGLWYASSEQGNDWTEELYYLIRYEGYETDTLLIRDIINPDVDRRFEFYINGELKELQAWWIGVYQELPELGYISIAK